jgi:predicted outer membrane protein
MSKATRVGRRGLTALSCLLIATTSVAAAQEGTRPGLTPAEKDFVNSWSMAMNYELAAARLAQSMGKAEAVRRFASAMLADHAAMATELGAAVAAADRSVALPTSLSVAGDERLRAVQAATAESRKDSGGWTGRGGCDSRFPRRWAQALAMVPWWL